MKKFLTISAILLLATTVAFAAEISNGIVEIPDSDTSDAPTTYFYVQAEAVSTAQGLLLKYGETSGDAVIVTETITKSSDENWNVFGVNQETEYFFLFGTGRDSAEKELDVTATAGEFMNGDISSGVTPTIEGTSPSASWSVTIPTANPIDGTFLDTSFQLTWDGSSSANINSAPAGLYRSKVTLTVTNP